jgi:hypothetical protein
MRSPEIRGGKQSNLVFCQMFNRPFVYKTFKQNRSYNIIHQNCTKRTINRTVHFIYDICRITSSKFEGHKNIRASQDRFLNMVEVQETRPHRHKTLGYSQENPQLKYLSLKIREPRIFSVSQI